MVGQQRQESGEPGWASVDYLPFLAYMMHHLNPSSYHFALHDVLVCCLGATYPYCGSPEVYVWNLPTTRVPRNASLYIQLPIIINRR